MPRSVYSETDFGATSRFSPTRLVTKFAAIAVLAASVLLGTATLASAAAIAGGAASTVSAGVVYVSWTGDATATSYAVTTSPTSAGCTVSVPLNTTSTIGCTVSGLTDGTSYVFTITPTAPSTTTASASTVTYTPTTAISNVVAYQAGANYAAVSFTADGIATLYTVTPSSGTGSCTVGTSTAAPTGTQTCYMAVNGTSPYIFTVTPNSGDTASTAGTSSSTAITATNIATAPTAKATAPGAVAITFIANNVATSYVVSDAVGDSCSVGNGTTVPTGLQTCTITGLSQSTSYSFTVTGLGGGSTTTWAATSSTAYPFQLATPTAANAGYGKVTVTFTADGAATLYTVSTPGGTSCYVGNSTTPPTGSQSCTVTGLTPNTAYTFTVHGNDSSTNATVAFTTAKAMAAPAFVSAGNGSVTVSFVGTGDATTYVVTTYLDAAPNTLESNTCTQVVAATSTATIQCTVTGLTPGTKYDFVVTPSGGTTTYVASLPSSGYTAGGSASTPVVTQLGNDQLSVSWMANGTATIYTVSDGHGVTCQVINTTTPPTGTQTCTLTDAAQDGNAVTITVTPNTGSTYAAVNVSAANSYTRALAAPTVVNAGSGAVTATFTADGHAPSYTVQSSNTVGAADSSCLVYNYTTAPTGTQSCTVKGLVNGVYYTFTVTPSSTTYSTQSAASAALLVGVNFAATPTAVWAGDGSAAVSFTSDGVASTYVVTATDSTTAANGGQTCTVSNSTTPPAKGAQSCTVTGLTDGDSYTFSVTPSGNGTTTTMSLPSAAFVASKAVAPFAPTGVTAVATATTLAVTWVAGNSGGSAITSYVVTATAGNTSTTCGTVAGTATTCTITGLTAGTAYAITVAAVNAIGTSPAATASATTTAAVTPPSAGGCFSSGAHGVALAGRTVTITISGGGFYGQPKITSTEFGTRAVVSHDSGTSLTVRVSTPANARMGWHTMTIRLANGKACRVNYNVK